MKRLTKGFLSFIMMTSYALGMSAQDATFVPADEIPSSLRDAASLKLTGTWGTSAFAELKMALGTNAIGGSNMVLTRVDMGEAVIEDGTSWYVSAGFTSNGVFSSCKALKEVVMPVAEEAAHLVSLEKAFAESEDVMIEAFMDGIELANGCYKTKDKSVVFPITEVVSKNEFFDYNAKYNGEVTEITPARLSPELTDRVRKLTSAVYDILGCKGIVRVDYIITEGEKINMLEINTTPGMTATSFIPQQVRAAGIDIKEVMTDIIEDSFQK